MTNQEQEIEQLLVEMYFRVEGCDECQQNMILTRQALVLIRKPTCSTCGGNVAIFLENIEAALEAMDSKGKFHRKIVEKACNIIKRQEGQIEYWQQAFKDRGGEIVDKSPDKPRKIIEGSHGG